MGILQRQTILILDFGSQYTQLIARRIREQSVYCEIHPYHISLDDIQAKRPRGIILSGGPSSVYTQTAPLPEPHIFDLGIPVLGICYGMQVLAQLSASGNVHPAKSREFGLARINLTKENVPLFQGLSSQFDVWMSHGDRIEKNA